MKNALKIAWRMAFSLALLVALTVQAQEKEKPEIIAKSIPELKEAIEAVLKETNTPAVGVAIVNAQGPVWIAGMGKANIEKNIDADSTTMFRIGSTSKMFVALSILKLQEEGKINLNDKVRDLAPDIEFENKWEETDPIRVVHLLEHTTGWDDIHLVEYAHNDSVPISLKDGLHYHPHSRISRWVPGTRMSYCNSGPPVAARIIEEITGIPFEDYVIKNFFTPMGMSGMTYLRTEEYKKKGAELYIDGQPQAYWNVILRSAGSINASPIDMAKMVQFFVNGARIDTTQIISPASLQRMETPMTTSGARAGMRAGYGLHNYTSFHKGFVYQSHNGGVNGGLTDLSYLPGHGVGYAVMINCDNGEALTKIVKLVRDYQTHDIAPPIVNADVKINEKHNAVAGYYYPISPRTQKFYFMEYLLNIHRVWIDGEAIHRKGLLGGDTDDYLPVSDVLFKSKKAGMTNMVITEDPLAGEVLHAETEVVKKTSALGAIGPIVVGCLWLLFIITSVLFALVWAIRFWMGKIQSGPTIQIRLWPLLASISFVALFFLVSIGGSDPFNYLGKIGFISISIMLTTILFAILSGWSLFVAIKERKADINKVVYWHSAIGSVLHVVVTVYLLWFGVIGIQIWA